MFDDMNSKFAYSTLKSWNKCKVISDKFKYILKEFSQNKNKKNQLISEEFLLIY